MRLSLVAATLVASLIPHIAGAAEVLRVFTSYPQEMMDRYEQAYARLHPEVKLDFTWGHTPDALATLRKPGQDGVDVFWSPAMKAFPLLAKEGAFRPLGAMLDGLPRRLGNQWISDPDGRYAAFEVASFGFVLREDYLKAHGLERPKEWKDLGRRDYAGHVVLPVPSLIGFAPPMVEVILQHYGWAKGWEILSKIAANSEMLDGGGGVALINELAEGSKGIGLTIDFFVRSAKAEGKPVEFIMPEATAFVPAQVAITAGTAKPKQAEDFVRFLLSEEGQELLFSPDVARLPVRPAAYAKAPAGTPRPFDAVTRFAYDQDKATRREHVVAALFDELLTSRHDELVALWPAVRALDGHSEAGHKARELVAFVPLSEVEAESPALLAAFENPESDAAMAERAKWGRAIIAARQKAQALVTP